MVGAPLDIVPIKLELINLGGWYIFTALNGYFHGTVLEVYHQSHLFGSWPSGTELLAAQSHSVATSLLRRCNLFSKKVTCEKKQHPKRIPSRAILLHQLLETPYWPWYIELNRLDTCKELDNPTHKDIALTYSRTSFLVLTVSWSTTCT